MAYDKDWIVWLNFVRDAYAEHHKLDPRDANAKLTVYMLSEKNKAKLVGLYNSQTGHAEAARQIGEL